MKKKILFAMLMSLIFALVLQDANNRPLYGEMEFKP